MPEPSRMRDFSAAEEDHARVVLDVLKPLVTGLARAFAPYTEVVLHDLTAFPQSIAAIAGNVTGRMVGGPPTDLGLKTLVEEPEHDLVGYRSTLPTGKVLHSSSLFVRAATGRAVVALCINTEISDLLRAQQFLATLAPLDWGSTTQGVTQESYPVSVDELSQGLLDEVIANASITVELMKKQHKMAVVAELDARGFFSLREAVEQAARRLAVSRYTIYNYLNELRADTPGPEREQLQQ